MAFRRFVLNLVRMGLRPWPRAIGLCREAGPRSGSL
jgi:hypothetical protein